MLQILLFQISLQYYMNVQNNISQPHSSPSLFEFLFPPSQIVTISSPPDSGNIALIRHITQFHFRLTILNDGTRTNHPVNSKSWFYFEVRGMPKNAKGKFVITRLQALSPMQSKYSKCYRPVIRKNGGQWRRVDEEVQLIMRQNGQLECVIEHHFAQEGQITQFAFCYPYPYQKHISFINSLSDHLFSQNYYFHSQVLCYSPQNLPVHLLTITSHDRCNVNFHEPQFPAPVFPEKKRPLRFDKPTVFVTGRVHPGQTPASYAMEGVIKFLLDQKDARAMLLRKMFVFMIVPMINVDGVMNGHFRMDALGKNLNRFYQSPSPTDQPAIFSIKTLITYLSSNNRLAFYFDLHAHNSKKGSFIYGNAFQQFVEQVQSQVYCKLMGLNHLGFQYEECNFSQKQMTVKDRNDDITKEGCGRVVVHRQTGIIHSYSVECGIISSNQIKTLPEPPNYDFHINEHKFIKDPHESNQPNQKFQRTGDDSAMFTEDTYRNLGKNLMVSILDVYDKNPYNRVYNSKYKSMQTLRRVTAFQIFHQAQRFRRYEKFVFGKVKNINPLIQQILNNKLFYQKINGFYFFEDADLKNVYWPNNIIGFQKPIKSLNSSKVKKFRSMIEHKCSQEQFSNKDKCTPKLQSSEQMINLKNDEDLQLSDKSSETEAENQEPIQSLCELFHQQEDQMLIKLGKNQLNEFDLKQIEQKLKNKTTYQTSNCELTISSYQSSQFKDKNIKIQRIHEIMNTKISPIKYRISKKLISINSHQMSNQQFKDEIDPIQFVSLVNQSQIKEESKFNAAQQFRKNVYETIKQQIRAGLRKQFEKKRVSNSKNKLQFGELLLKNNVRVRSTNQDDHKRLKTKVRFPSLGTNMYIMTNSSKLINKK